MPYTTTQYCRQVVAVLWLALRNAGREFTGSNPTRVTAVGYLAVVDPCYRAKYFTELSMYIFSDVTLIQSWECYGSNGKSGITQTELVHFADKTSLALLL